MRCVGAYFVIDCHKAKKLSGSCYFDSWNITKSSVNIVKQNPLDQYRDKEFVIMNKMCDK